MGKKKGTKKGKKKKAKAGANPGEMNPAQKLSFLTSQTNTMRRELGSFHFVLHRYIFGVECVVEANKCVGVCDSCAEERGAQCSR